MSLGGAPGAGLTRQLAHGNTTKTRQGPGSRFSPDSERGNGRAVAGPDPTGILGRINVQAELTKVNPDV